MTKFLSSRASFGADCCRSGRGNPEAAEAGTCSGGDCDLSRSGASATKAGPGGTEALKLALQARSTNGDIDLSMTAVANAAGRVLRWCTTGSTGGGTMEGTIEDSCLGHTGGGGCSCRCQR